jgi:hypothetical protein
MVETTLDISFAAVGESCAIVSDVSGELAQQAELVAFAHFVGRIVSLLGPARAGPVVETLLADGQPERVPGAAASSVRAIARFVDGATGPRMYFRLKRRGPLYAALSVHAVRETLRGRYGGDEQFRRRLARESELLGRLGATGQIRADNEFDIALAAADVACRFTAQEPGDALAGELECPACGNTGDEAPFELRIWPSADAFVRRCGRCGAGIWRRAGHGPRLIRGDIWSAMESMREELGGTRWRSPSDGGARRPLLNELKRVFGENGWPYSEVDGAPVLVSELSGPEGRWDFYAQAVEEKGLVLLYSIAPQRVPEERRQHVSDFLTRANYGLADGNFELDFDDGEVRFKTVLHVEGDELDRLLVRRAVRWNGTALETYLPSIGSVIAGTRTR